jgi:RNA polymerase sigma factor (sigma-70 family)
LSPQDRRNDKENTMTRHGLAQHRGKPSQEQSTVHLGTVALHVITTIFHTHYERLCRHAIVLGAADRHDAEDLVAEAFYQLHARWPEVHDTDAAVGYLWATLRNLIRMDIRHTQVVRKHQPAIQAECTPARSAEQEALAAGERQTVAHAVHTLPHRQREAITLRFWFDLTYTEIAATMGISPGAVKVHLFRGLAGLRTALENDRPVGRPDRAVTSRTPATLPARAA